MTTEFALLSTFRTRMLPYEGRTVDAEMQEIIKDNGTDVVKSLQQNHGHSLADAVSLMRAVLNDLKIVKA